MDRKPRILIGSPCYGNVVPEVLEDWMRFMYHCGRRLPQYDFMLGIRTKSEQFRARNVIVEEGQRSGADWLLFLDDDMIINPFQTSNPTEEYNLIERLLAHDKDIVGALYYQRTGGCAPVSMMAAGERGYRFLRDDELTGGLQEVDVAGGGALLIKMSVFDKLPHPYFAPEHEFGTDVQLCRAAKKAGFKIYLDSSIELGHVRDERLIITSRNKAQYSLEQMLPGEARKQVTTDVFTRLVADGLEYTGYMSPEELAYVGQRFMTKTNLESHVKVASDLPGWYRQFPRERVARQVWYNSASSYKRQLTEHTLGTINDSIKANILDFGAGIGVTAFELAQRGHHVTAADIEGTGTTDFLKWRCEKYKVPMTFHRLTGTGLPHFGGTRFAAIIVMDCLEHIPDWRGTLKVLVSHLEPGGVLFANNGILDDHEHPEHFPLEGKDFYKECAGLGLVPFSPIGFIKQEAKKEVA